MKIMIIISLLLSSLFAQEFTKKEFANKSIELGWNYENCSFGSSGIHIKGHHFARSLATEKAVSKLVISKCGKKENNVITSSGTISYKILMTAKVKDRIVSAVCATKPILCTNK